MDLNSVPSTGCGSRCERCELVNGTVSHFLTPYNLGFDPSTDVSFVGAICVCDPWANAADLAPNRNEDCSIHFLSNKGVHAFAAFVWLTAVLTSVLGLVFARRALWTNTIKERFVMAVLLVASILASACHVLQSSASYPGEHSIGLSLTTTALYQVALCLCFLFLFSLPLVRSGTSVIPFAFQNVEKRTMSRLMIPLALVLLTISQLATGITYAVVFYPERTTELLIIYYSFMAVWLGVITVTFIYMTSKTISKMGSLLTSSQLASSQKNKVLLAHRSARKVRAIATIAFFLTTPPYTAFAASPSLARHSYIMTAMTSSLMGAIVGRHALVSFLMSRSVSARHSENKKLTGEGNKLGANNNNDDEEEEGDDQYHSGVVRGADVTNDSGEVKTDPFSGGSQSFSSFPSGTKMKTLGKKLPSKYRSPGKKKKKVVLMTRVTEENTIDRSTYHDGTGPYSESTNPLHLQPLSSGDNTMSE